MQSAPPALSPQLIKKIQEELLIETPLRKADLLFVFGTRHAVPAFIDTIADLWNKQLFQWLLISGGPTAGRSYTEAEALVEGIASLNIPASHIIIEDRAMNTGENVTLSLPLIHARIGLPNVRSVIALGKHCGSARYLMTLQRHWPSVEKMLVTVNHFDIRNDEWHLHPEAQARIVAEWRKLEPYKRLGYISEWPGERVRA
jgi:uncharacterized SAM-binding protein YcdF (DUF218 family)